jgi:Zn-dependent peptidase ImmA (M78 family)
MTPASTHVSVQPTLIRWSRERARLERLELVRRFPKLAEWESGERQPTLRQLEEFARAVHGPIGFLFLPTPPEEGLPIPDFRTIAGHAIARPTPDLLDTIYLCQQRQDWYRDYARVQGEQALPFVASARLSDDPLVVAASIRATLSLSFEARRDIPTWTEALRQLVACAEEAGVLVMASSVVGSNSHRKLTVSEFRGFALVDPMAPLVFLNAADSKSAQMFTLAHELAHVWLGESGVLDTEAGRVPVPTIERWCNAVAAELLMPLRALEREYLPHEPIDGAIQRLARVFKVSTLVALRRLFEAAYISDEVLGKEYSREVARLRTLERRDAGGGDFYRTLGARTGRRFARAVLASTLEGQTLFTDAFRMLGMRKSSTFFDAARELGVMA